MRGGDPKPIGSGLEQVVGRLGGKGRGSARAAAAWTETVGQEVARHTYVAGVRGQEILVHVDSPAWATELTAMREQLIDRMREALGKTPVTSLRFTVTNEVSRVRGEEQDSLEAARGYGGGKVEPVELEPEELEGITRMFSDIGDPALREAAARAVKRDLEWKKGVEAAERRERRSGDL